MFELSQRYNEIKHKSETLMDITEVFSNLSHARRSSRLEWIIIILIIIEIVIYVFEIMWQQSHMQERKQRKQEAGEVNARPSWMSTECEPAEICYA